MVSGKMIKDLRFEYGYGKTEFAKMIGIIPKTLSRIESKEAVKDKYIKKIEQALNIDLAEYAMDISKQPIGKKIKYYRVNAGYSSVDFAKLVGIDKTYIYYIEAGIRKPSPTLLKKICIVLDVPIKEFMFLSLNENNTIGEQLRYYRVLNGFTQKELAKQVSESKEFISRAERNLFSSEKQLTKINRIIKYLNK